MVGYLDESTESGQDPLIRERKLKPSDSVFLWLEARSEVGEGKLVDVPELVAELSVSNNSLDIKIDAALDHVVHQTESQGISSTFWDTSWEIFGFGNHCFLDFAFC